jgi:hypothetical protein
MPIISSSSSNFMPSSIVAIVVNPIVYVFGMAVAHSTLAMSSSGALGSCVEAILGWSMGPSVDNECRSDSLLSIGNPSKASFSDIVNARHSPHPLVQEALA